MKDWTVKQCLNAGPGRHRVSHGLYLWVSPDRTTRRWIHRFTKPNTGRVTEMGLGSMDLVSLAEARDKVLEARRAVKNGQDPIEQRESDKRAKVTFAEVAVQYLAHRAHRYRNPNTVKGLKLLLLTHAAPLGSMAVADIG